MNPWNKLREAAQEIRSYAEEWADDDGPYMRISMYLYGQLDEALEELEDSVSYSDIKLAEMIMSDCGVSSDNTSLRDRIVKRISENQSSRHEWLGLSNEEKHKLNTILNLQGRFAIIEAIESILRNKNE